MASSVGGRLSVLLMTMIVIQQVATSQHDNPSNDDVNTHAGEIVVPVKVDSRGEFVSHVLHHEYVRDTGQSVRRRRRSTDVDADADVVHYRLDVGGENVHLQLRPNHVMMAFGLVVERRTPRANMAAAAGRQCHYLGTVRDHNASLAAISTCNGLRGIMKFQRGEFFIEPVKDHDLQAHPAHPHLVYRRSLPSKNSVPSSQLHNTCASEDNLDAIFNEREQWEVHEQNVSGTNKSRKRRSVSTERNVETLVVADKRMIDYYEADDIETYILTVMNMVSSLYRDASIGNAINIVLVRIILLETEEHELQEDLTISHHADNTLKSFCKWQKLINPRDESHPNHHDVAILLTRYNICTRMNEPCSTLGLAEVAGMCQPHRSCSVNEDTGLALAYTIAHEMGHNFGMSHDGPHNGCQAAFGEQQHVMSPHLHSDSSPMIWSICSRRELTKFLDRDWGLCLDDEPSDHEFSFPEVPPGAMYDADHQCRLQYGPDASYCYGIEDVCLTLWCRLENKCVTRMEPAASGTWCGKHKWCFMGECSLMGERPEAIDGDWGHWSEWSECTRTCGAGVRSAERNCNNPFPANGGRYCIGERKKYSVCNMQPCPEGSISFRAVQCLSHNNKSYKGELYSWMPVITSVAPCQLHCKPEDKFFSLMLSDTVIDGTPCRPGTKDICINGKCRKVSCDWGIESGAQEDRCGICHGDGTQCHTLKGEFLQEQGIGYVEVVSIPQASRNIRVEEFEDSANYLAVKADNDSYYLNGNFFIHWSGEYRAAGSVIYYQRDGEKETLHIPGPILEDLHIMLLYQTANPGIRYEYTIALHNVTRKPEFHWEYTDWSVCTTTCGGGIQVSYAHCLEKEAGLVDDEYCNATIKPQEIIRICNKHQCPARWWSGPWQHCTVTCGNNGIRKRTVMCVRSFGKGEQLALNDKDCEESLRPHEIEPCLHKLPCPGDIYWKVGNWSVTCKGDPCNSQTRKAWCSIEGGPCNPKTKPSTFRQCGNITCGQWKTGNWSNCSQSCGYGFQFRRVSCDGGLKCLDLSEPESIRPCSNKCFSETHKEQNFKNGLLLGDNTSRQEDSTARSAAENVVTSPDEGSGHDDESASLKLVENEQPEADKAQHNKNRWHYDVPKHGSKKKHHKSVKERRPRGFVEDKVDPGDFQVVAIENKSLDEDKFHAMTDDWFQENDDIWDYKMDKGTTVFVSSDETPKNSSGVRSTFIKLRPQFEWRIGDWTECTKLCNGGHRSREILCFEMNTRTPVDSELCNPHTRPLYMETCNLYPCLKWELSEWSSCSRTCDQGTKTRTVHCPEPNKCNIDAKPEEQITCQLHPCIDWLAGEWSQCSVSCGGGGQTRDIKCMDFKLQQSTSVSGCDVNRKPMQWQKCNSKKCPMDKPARQSSCLDKLDRSLCISLQHMCTTWYFKVKCCYTCKKYTKLDDT